MLWDLENAIPLNLPSQLPPTLTTFDNYFYLSTQEKKIRTSIYVAGKLRKKDKYIEQVFSVWFSVQASLGPKSPRPILKCPFVWGALPNQSIVIGNRKDTMFMIVVKS